MTYVIEDRFLDRGLPNIGNRALAAWVLAALIHEGQVEVYRCADHIDFIGAPGDTDVVSVRVMVPTDSDASVARWLNISPDLVQSDPPDAA